jgi:hypothetical protein
MTRQKCFDGSVPRILVDNNFIKRNKLSLRSIDEIKEQIKENSKKIIDFSNEVLYYYMPFEEVKKDFNDDFVKKVETGKETWNQITDVKEAAQDFVDYMNFAWSKAMDQRGLSASRSIDKLSTWLWLMGRDDLVQIITDDSLYNPYGAPALIEVSKRMKISVPKELKKFAKQKV